MPHAFRTDLAGRSVHGTATKITDYTGTVRSRRKEDDETDGTQPGDPVRAAHVLVEVIWRKVLPVRLLLGGDAVQVVRSEIAAQLTEIEEWMRVSARTRM